MECGADEAERFKRHFGLAVLNNETLIENDMFCIACMAELKARPPPSKEAAEKRAPPPPPPSFHFSFRCQLLCNVVGPP